ncbi:MAG: hypothetical protein DSZ12_01150 [Sulfurovum sp.]|nr:MAG: hypothetical protein DSZ12_01150 [Sulfurovum sp.]
MKRILFLLISLLMLMLLISCNCNEKKPPARAFFNKTSAYGMQYHITLYQLSYGGGTHSFKCGSWSYSPFHVFTDRLGTLKGDEVIIKGMGMSEPPYVDYRQVLNDINLLITRDTVKITGVKGEVYNGVYKVETSSSDSWGVPINEEIFLPEE